MGRKWRGDEVRRTQERRRSGAAGIHGDRRHSRRRARDAVKRAEIEEGLAPVCEFPFPAWEDEEDWPEWTI